MAHANPRRPLQALAAAALAGALVPPALALSVADPPALAGAFLAWGVAAYLWAVAGTLAAATAFGPGEPLRPAWLLLAASYLALLPSRLAAGLDLGGLAAGDGPGRFPVVVAILGATSGALGVVGFLLLARAWHAAGLDLTSRRSRVAARLLALAVAAALAGPDLVSRLPAALGGDPLAATDVLTDLLDAALFVVAVPVLRAALALGGGLVAWPWGLLTLSLLAWLGYDASVAWSGAAGLSPATARVTAEAMRSLGAGALAAAGLAQRWIMLAPGGAHGARGGPLGPG